MTVCHVCQANNEDTAQFCFKCGASLSSAPIILGESQNVRRSNLNARAVVSVLFGIGSIVLWILVFVKGSLIGAAAGTAAAAAGLVLGATALKSQKAGMAITGLVTSIIGIILTVIFGLMVVLLAMGVSNF